MESNTTKKELVMKVVGDVLYIGLKIGTVVVMWKCIGRVNHSQLNWIVKIIGTAPMWNRIIDDGYKGWKRGKSLMKRISDYRMSRIEEELERVNELVKNSRACNDVELNEALDEIMKEFEGIGLDIRVYQDQIKENTEEILKEMNEETA